MRCSEAQPTAVVSKQRLSDILQVVTLEKPSFCEHFITCAALEGLDARRVVGEIAAFLEANDASVVSQDIFASVDVGRSLRSVLEERLGAVTWPLTWTDSGSQSLAGIQVWAISGGNIRSLALDSGTVGVTYEDDCARYCRLAGVSAADLTSDRVCQARDVFKRLEQKLQESDFKLSDMLRTWFYLNDILAWYGDFNNVRDNFFAEKGVFDGLVPASTGIGSGNMAGSALVGGLVAVQAKNGSVRSFPVASPLQCPALDYGSSFSRAAELDMPCHRRLYVSGTASIAPEGHTAHVGDVDAQIVKTMEVVEAILKSRDMDWCDVVRAIAYIRDAKDLPRYAEYIREHDMPDMPVVVTNSTVCRDDLLFEIEVDAICAK